MAEGPSTIGRYRVVGSLGRGGAARVYLTLSSGPGGFNKLLVVKVLRGAHQDDPDMRHAFVAEGNLAARLNHPNLVQTFEVSYDGEVPFIAMEYLEGQPLNEVLGRVGALNVPLELRLGVICRVLDGLHFVHELRDYDGEKLDAVHRDISPHNVFLNYDGQVKVVDFGIAKTAVTTLQTQFGLFKGKVGYCAPEQLRCEKADRRADIFAVGVMLWECLTGRRFRSKNEMKTIQRRVSGTEPRVIDINPGVPVELAAICERARTVEPSKRYQTASEMADALEQFMQKNSLHFDPRALGALLKEQFAEEQQRVRELVREAVERSEVTSPGAGHSLAQIDGADTTHYAMPYGTRGSQTARWQRTGLWASAALVLAFAGTVGAVGIRHVKDSDPPATLATSVSSATPARETPTVSTKPPPPPEPERVATMQLTILVSPSDSRVTLDGAQLSSIPFSAELRRDGKVHVVRAARTGYQPQEHEVTFSEDRNVIIDLAPRHKRPAKPPAAKPRAESGLSIDDSDPYR